MIKVAGIDVSRWQGLMNWAVAEAAGAQFGYIRAGSVNNETGAPYTDFQFENNANNCHLPYGFYWFFRPQHSPVRQAEYFFELIRGLRWRLLPVIDIETSGGLSSSQAAQSALAFVNRLKVLSGVVPAIYTRATIWNPLFGSAPWGINHGLWVARYSELLKEPWSGLSSEYRPRPWTDWVLWQWSADGNLRGHEFGASGSHSIDINAFNGTQEELEVWLGNVLSPQPPQPVPVPPPLPPSPGDEVMVPKYQTALVLRTVSKRDQHETSSSWRGYRLRGQQFPILGKWETGRWPGKGYELWVFDGYHWTAFWYDDIQYLELMA
jgi:GH25 family lysozyme M1 (1,4-beta-N-acetylmuramidase)